jgi:hypothetical protein
VALVRFRHTHRWEIAAKTFAPPAYGLELGACTMSEHMAERLTFGVTTVLLKCADCGRTRTEEMLGPEAKITP